MNIDHQRTMFNIGANGGHLSDHCHHVIIVTLMITLSETVPGVV